MNTDPLTAAAAAFDRRTEAYDQWFDENPDLYQAEVVAIAALLNPFREACVEHCAGLEIGVGSGRFAAALGIERGIDPAPRMVTLARQRGIRVDEGVAERLPYPDDTFDYTAFITSLGFVEDAPQALREARRVTRNGGAIIVAFLNRATPAGQALAQNQATDPYYCLAHLRTDSEIRELVRKAGFEPTGSRQVCTTSQGETTVRAGTDSGLFCVISASTTAAARQRA